VEVKDKNGDLNGITIHRLKDKLGTKAVPTAELELNKTSATLVGPLHRGVPVIASILNITRIHNAINAVACMRRAIAHARDYAHRREVFGKKLADNALHLSILADMEVQFRGALIISIDVTLLMGLSELKKTSPSQELMLRILTPLLKLYTAKQTILVVSEAIECLGGTGYMEDTDMPRLLRDAQVLPIWEGTTNVLSMDVWRPLSAPSALGTFGKYLEAKTEGALPALAQVVTYIHKSFSELTKFVEAQTSTGDLQTLQASARHFSYALSRVYIAALLIEQAKFTNNPTDILVAERWITKGTSLGFGDGSFDVAVVADEKRRADDSLLALDLDENRIPRNTGNVTRWGTPRSKY